jgi:hypothetical protein
MVNFIAGADLLDEISITDTNGDLVSITDLPGFEVWYYISTSPILIYKFSKETPTPVGYLPFVIEDEFNYKAYLEGNLTNALKSGPLVCDVYIATTNADLVKGYFINLGTKDLTINVIKKPISDK